MMLARVRNAAIGGLAVLLLSGAGVAFAGNSPAPMLATTPSAAVQSATGSALATGQQVDVQQGDQTTPDAAGTSAAEQAGVEAPEFATEAAGAETDGPGGWADAAGAAGANVDTQQQGEH